MRSPGLARRVGALLYDAILLLGLMMVFTALILTLTDGEAIKAGNWYYRGFLVVMVVSFFTWFWTHGGQTLGMRAWRLKLVTTQDQVPRVQACLWRLVFAAISLAGFGLGLIWVIVDPENRSWHGRRSNTQLVLLP